MTVRLNTNLASLNAQRRLGEVTSSLGKTYERLSSGLRINRASDDAAGLAVASGLNVDSRVFSQGLRNINDGISALQIADGALEELSNVVTRIIELSEQASNGVISATQGNPKTSSRQGGSSS
jgi:flagellin